MNITINNDEYIVENISSASITINPSEYKWNDFQIFGIKEVNNINRNGIITIDNYKSKNQTLKVVYNDYKTDKNNMTFTVEYAELI